MIFIGTMVQYNPNPILIIKAPPYIRVFYQVLEVPGFHEVMWGFMRFQGC